MEQKMPDIFRSLCEYHCPRYEELPHIALYKDQVVSVLNEAVSPFYPHGETPVTATMVNNYVKMRVIERPVNKKYSRVQLARLVTLCAMKQVLSLPELSALSEIGLARYPMPKAYNYFCVELENALRTAFSPAADPEPDTADAPNDITLLVRRFALAFASKIYVQKRVQFERQITLQ